MMPKIVRGSLGELGKRSRAQEYYQGPRTKITFPSWPLETYDKGCSTLSNGSIEMEEFRTEHQIQPDTISEFDITEGEPLFKRARTQDSENSRRNNILCTYDGLGLGLDTGKLHYQCAPEHALGCSFSLFPEAVLANDTERYNRPFQKQTSRLPNGCINGHFPELMPSSKSGLDSPCFSQHKCTTNETEDTNTPPNNIRKELIASSPTEVRISRNLNQEPSENKSSKVKGLENQDTGELGKVDGNHEDQPSTASIGKQGIPTTQFSRGWSSGEDTQRKYSSIKQNIQSDNEGNCPRKKWLTCLWYKKDPLKYSDCARYKLLRIKDVKQHTYRRHMKPKIYCLVCFEVFATEEEKDGHMKKKSCTSRTKPEFDGLSEQQRKQLNQSANRGRNDVERWYYMWNTIFPGERKPRSPYLGNSRQELLPQLRSFWKEKHQEIIYNALQESSQRKLGFEMIETIMDIIFDRLEDETLNQEFNSDGHLSDGVLETPGTQEQLPMIFNDATLEDPPPQQAFTDYGLLWDPSQQQLPLEYKCALESILGRFGNDSALYGIGY